MRVIFQFLPNVNNYLELQERFNASTGEYEQALKCIGYSNISLPFQQPSTSHVN